MSTADDDGLRAIAAQVEALSAENKRLFRELVTAEKRSRTLSRAVWRVQEDERRRLARELHDGIGQLLVALKHQLETARTEDALETATQALHDTRELSRLLRPAILDDLGLEPALRWLARTVSERFEIEIETDVHGIGERLDREIETLAFRIVQEALTNAVKHSGASAAQVTVERTPRHLKLSVSDAGRGFDPTAEGDGTVGLRGMRDRAELFGGTIRIDSNPGGGTRIEVVVPLELP